VAIETTRITEKSIDLSHGKTYYYEAGEGTPLILLHGSGIEQGGADFLPSFPVLSRAFRVIAPDFVGWPPGDSFANFASFPYLTDFVREFQDAMGIRKSHVVGVSMGGWIAGLFAYESPDRVEKAVITGNPGLLGSPNRRMASWQPPADEAIRKWMQPVLSGSGLDEEAVIARKTERARDSGIREGFARIMSHMADDANRKRYALDRRYPHVSIPVLFLWGKTDPHVEQAAVCHSLTPGSSLRILDAGHRLHVEEPVVFGEAVLEYLR
jgi:pimeloyl-ACP methyl ester carboxylesterase